jgi:hypothetical protein
VLDERIGLFEPSHDEEIGRLNSKKSKSPQCLQPSLSTLSMKEWLAKILQRVDTRLDKLDNEGTETQWASQTVEAGRSAFRKRVAWPEFWCTQYIGWPASEDKWILFGCTAFRKIRTFGAEFSVVPQKALRRKGLAVRR